jgi:preprotein translocase SecE subunit
MSNDSGDPRKDDKLEKPKAPSSIATPKFRRGFKGFVTETRREMNKVTWPSRKETNRLTVVVLSLVVVIAVMLSLMGWASDTIVAIITKGKV